MATKRIKLTKKQQGFVEDYVMTGNGTEAAMKHYKLKSRKSAAVLASENLTKPNILGVIESIADKIPDSLLIEKHLALLNKMNGKEIDVHAVAKALDLAYKLKGMYAPEKHLHRGKIDFNSLDNLSNEELDRIIEAANLES